MSVFSETIVGELRSAQARSGGSAPRAIMSDMLLAAFVVFVAAVFVATTLLKRSLAALTGEEKVQLVDAAAKTSTRWFLLAMLLVAAWIAVLVFRRDLMRDAVVVVLAAFLVLSVSSATATWRRYRAHGLPPPFLRTYLIAYGIRLTAAIFLFSTAAATMLHR